ncbi:MAG: hypothetical protein KGJ09_05935 [Candidatus Omnitrophica bacterium]|nr:hypothetical protein [Candidatus Omnitrophota bacterium]MDE2009600.1 hypothetical protein [Candidatus Omnitrophota bacterium]MDE2214472.1 hypothetical protein [Candidatus Omnitrophota bacterium]MDE2231612.1 hypothetical protein [Candidatus Omnitrophota bacterium]
MSISLYLAVVFAALYWVARILLPELAGPSLTKKVSPPDGSAVDLSPETGDKGIEKLETLLKEKNDIMAALQRDLKISQIQVRESDKIKSLLEEEIRRLREQNRMFRSELGLPAIQPQENPLT